VIGWQACLQAAWALAMVPTLIILVRVDGITGAALAHLALFLPFALAYLCWGTKRLTTRPAAFLFALRGIAVAALAQGVITYAALLLLERLVAPLTAAVGAAGVGFAALAFVIGRFVPSLAGECRAFAHALAARPRPA
jgi:hypothetical protein